MNKAKYLINNAVLLVALLAVCFTSPVYASSQVIERHNFDSHYTKSGICAFDLSVHETGMFMDKKKYDNQGNLVSEMHVYGGNIYYLTANGKTVTVQNNGTVKFVFVSPDESQVSLSGQQWVWTIPGQGPVSGEIGRREMTYTYENGEQVAAVVRKLVGNIMWTDVAPLMCTYLAP